MEAALKLEKKRILVADDEAQIRSILDEQLSHDFEVAVAANGEELLIAVKTFRPDLILLDMMMPVLDGLGTIKCLRADALTRHIPVLMLTAANTPKDRIDAYELGADDFISKPFSFDELIVRIRSRLNRMVELRLIPPERIDSKNLTLDLRSREVRVGSELVELSPVEFGILNLLLLKLGEVVSRKDIMKEVWEDGRKSDRLIDAHVTSLRKKLSNYDGDLQTVYGAGYRIKV